MIRDLSTFTKVIKKYYKKSPINNANLIDYFLITYSKYSYYNLLKLQNIKVDKLSKFIAIIKEFIGSVNALDFELANKNKITEFNKLILTTGRCSNVSSNGDYFDKYFNESSRDHPKILWFVINLDKQQPKKIGENILFFTNRNNKFSFFKNLIVLIIKKFLSFFGKKKSFFYLEILSKNIWKNINNSIDVTRIKEIITPYEGQPFQNYLNYKLKTNSKNIKTIGYVHATQGFPIHLFKRFGAPEILYVHGSDHKYHLSKFLGWDKKQIKIIPSLKIRKKNKKIYQNTIFLPFDIQNKKFYLQNFESLIKIYKKKLPDKLKIKIHPLRTNHKEHIEFKELLQSILKNNKRNKNLKFCGPIILGSASIVLEALENKLDVYHIHENFVLEGYSNYYWPNILIRKIKRDSISLYKIKKINTCIYIDGEKNIDFLKSKL